MLIMLMLPMLLMPMIPIANNTKNPNGSNLAGDVNHTVVADVANNAGYAIHK